MFQINSKIFQINKQSILIGAAVLLVIITGGLIFFKYGLGKTLTFNFGLGMSADAVARKSVDYLNSNILQKEQGTSLESFSEESGVVKFTIKIAGQTYDSYATKDGKLLFPQAFNMSQSSGK